MATIPLNFPDEIVPEARAAFGEHLHLERPATVAEVKEYFVQHAKQIIRQYRDEQRRATIAAQLAATAVPDPDIT